MRSNHVAIAGLAALWLLSIGADAHAADSPDTEARLAEIERRLDGVEDDAPAGISGRSWTDFVRLGGSANAGWYDGRQNGPWMDGGFRVWDARFFIDAELGEEANVFGNTWVRNAGVSFEWDLVVAMAARRFDPVVQDVLRVSRRLTNRRRLVSVSCS